jgi:hypothetical protein
LINADDEHTDSMAKLFEKKVGAHLIAISLKEVSFYCREVWVAWKRRIFIIEELC